MAMPFPRPTPAQFASPGLATQVLVRAGKTSFTTKRYVPFILKLFGNNKIIIKKIVQKYLTKNKIYWKIII
jgi:hypothetical protein